VDLAQAEKGNNFLITSPEKAPADAMAPYHERDVAQEQSGI
jgi:hypothetical protein